MMARKFKLSREQLEDMYWNQGLSTVKIAEKLGVHHATVGYWMIKFGIERRHLKATLSKKEYLRKYYLAHKAELREKNEQYKQQHKARLKELAKKKYKKEREMWLGGEICVITKEISKKAEVLAKSVLEHEGFTDIVKFTEQSVFDYFARKNGKICAIDVSTAMRKPIRRQQVEMALYFDLDVYLLIIKPDFKKYKLMRISKAYLKRKIRNKSVSIHNLQGFKELFTEIISLDIDSSLLELWKDDWLKAQKAILESYGYLLQRTIIRPSGEPLPWKKTQIKTETKAKHFHVWHHIITPYKLSDMENLKLQFLLGSDYGRCWINYLRITKRKNVLWNKIFGYIVWRRPLEEPCKSCHLRKYLEELAECPTTQE